MCIKDIFVGVMGKHLAAAVTAVDAAAAVVAAAATVVGHGGGYCCCCGGTTTAGTGTTAAGGGCYCRGGGVGLRLGYNINVPWDNGECGDADYVATRNHILIHCDIRHDQLVQASIHEAEAKLRVVDANIAEGSGKTPEIIRHLRSRKKSSLMRERMSSNNEKLLSYISKNFEVGDY
ncbi:hypothetical protein Tco_0964425 [Tanacetum coccineum]